MYMQQVQNDNNVKCDIFQFDCIKALRVEDWLMSYLQK